jgi:DNA-binding NarL/FixJ family response regulator
MVGFADYEERRRHIAAMNGFDPIRILIVDDHPLLREGIESLVRKQSDMTVAAEASSGAEAVDLFRIHRPDVTLMDVRMPGLNGLDAMTEILRDFPQAKFIVLTTYGGDVQILRALKAGARAYLLKGLLRKELLDTIRSVHAGRKRIPPEIAAQIADHAGESSLTEREIGVLQLIAAGNPNKLVADQLLITEDTVKAHVKSILSKLSANDRTHAVTIAIKRGIIDL